MWGSGNRQIIHSVVKEFNQILHKDVLKKQRYKTAYLTKYLAYKKGNQTLSQSDDPRFLAFDRHHFFSI